MNPEPGTGAGPGACDDEDLRIAVGALALGALDPDEAREVRRHLAECPECQAEYASFVGVKRIMDIGLVGAPMPELPTPDKPRKRLPFRTPVRALGASGASGTSGASGGSAASGTSGKLRLPGTPWRRRILVGVAALVLVIGGFWAGHSGRPGPTADVAGKALPAVTESGVTAQISYQGRGWGTSVTARMSGTPDGLNCTLYVVAKNHDAVPLSNWRSVAGKAIDIPAATSLQPGQIDHFEVRVASWGGYDITVPMSS